jgi:hypothetical protein
MNLFKNVFKKKKKTYSQADYKLLIIDDAADQLHLALGITEERADELLDTCIHSYHKNGKLHDCLVDVVDECKHTNEVVFSTMILTRVIEKYSSKDRLVDILKHMFGNG